MYELCCGALPLQSLASDLWQRSKKETANLKARPPPASQALVASKHEKKKNVLDQKEGDRNRVKMEEGWMKGQEMDIYM